MSYLLLAMGLPLEVICICLHLSAISLIFSILSDKMIVLNVEFDRAG